MSQLDDRSPRPDRPGAQGAVSTPRAATTGAPTGKPSGRPTGKPTGLPAPATKSPTAPSSPPPSSLSSAPPPPASSSSASGDSVSPRPPGPPSGTPSGSNPRPGTGLLDGPDVPADGSARDVVADTADTGSMPVVASDPDLEVDDDELYDFDDDEYYWEDDGTAAPAMVQSRGRKRKEWRQTERARRYAARKSVRFPIFTRAVLLWMLLFALVGTAFGGSSAFFWAHFNTQISELREQTKDFDKRSQEAQGQIDAMRNQAITDINRQLKPIAPYIAESKTIQIAQVFAPYVWLVATLGEEGEASVGTAFAVAGDGPNTLMVTSLNTVSAASLTPAPAIELRKGTESLKAISMVGDMPPMVSQICVQVKPFSRLISSSFSVRSDRIMMVS